MSSIDLIPPGLQDQLVQLRSPHAAASDHLWRTERMVRYAYWLRSNRQATSNLFGSWTRADMETEIAFWSTFGQDTVSDEIVAAGEAQIQASYAPAARSKSSSCGRGKLLQLSRQDGWMITRRLRSWQGARQPL